MVGVAGRAGRSPSRSRRLGGGAATERAAHTHMSRTHMFRFRIRTHMSRTPMSRAHMSHRGCKLSCPDTSSEVSDADARGEEGLSVVHVQCDPAALSQDGLGVLGELAQHRDGVGRAYGAERLRRLVSHLLVDRVRVRVRVRLSPLVTLP